MSVRRSVVLVVIAGVAVACKSNVITQTNNTTVVGPAGGTIAGPNGAKLTIPPGAVKSDTTFSIAVAPPGSYPALPNGVVLAGSVYAFEPIDATFAVPVTVALPLAGSGSEVVGQAPSGGSWSTLPSQTADNAATAQTVSLGYFAGEQAGFGSCKPHNEALAQSAAVSTSMGGVTFSAVDGLGCGQTPGAVNPPPWTIVLTSFPNANGLAEYSDSGGNTAGHVGDVVVVTASQTPSAGTSYPITSVRVFAFDGQCNGTTVESASCTGSLVIASADSSHIAGSFQDVSCPLKNGGTGTVSGSFDVKMNGVASGACSGTPNGPAFDPSRSLACCIP